jgi:hypothetical protein
MSVTGIPTTLPKGRWTPGGKKPASENKNFVIQNCTFVSDEADGTFIRQHFYRRREGYLRNIREDLRAYNNRYFNSKNPRPFQLDSVTWRPDPGDTYGTFADWKKQSRQPDFEAGSAWGATAPRNFKPATPVLAKAGTNTKPQSAGSQLVYEVENLPFKATGALEVWPAPGAGANKIHKLQVNQVGDYGDWVEYSLHVPQTGDYWVDVRYLQDAGAFNYLGYAHLQIDGKVQGDWWDQHGLSRGLMNHHIGTVRLTAGPHTFRFNSVWRNGYGSGDYDITVDRITLSRVLATRPALASAPAQVGLKTQMFEGGDWTRLPDFSRLAAEESGTSSSFDLAMAEDKEKFRCAFHGFRRRAARWHLHFATTANDGANLYIDEALVVDNDGRP